MATHRPKLNTLYLHSLSSYHNHKDRCNSLTLVNFSIPLLYRKHTMCYPI